MPNALLTVKEFEAGVDTICDEASKLHNLSDKEKKELKEIVYQSMGHVKTSGTRSDSV